MGAAPNQSFLQNIAVASNPICRGGWVLRHAQEKKGDSSKRRERERERERERRRRRRRDYSTND
jgi:hypothetical protein